VKAPSRRAALYFLRYRINGKRPEVGSGSIADVKLAGERAVEELSGKLGKKIDLIAEHRAEWPRRMRRRRQISQGGDAERGRGLCRGQCAVVAARLCTLDLIRPDRDAWQENRMLTNG
jgi:hypothetical protein